MLFGLLVPPGSAARDRVADGLAIAAALLYGAFMVYIGDATSPGAAVPWPVDVALGTTCAASLVVRRRHPVALALVLLPFGAVSVMATGAILAMLLTVAVRRPARPAFLLAAGHVATSAGYFLLQHEPPFPLWVDLVMRAATAAGAIGWGLFLGALRERTTRLEAEQQLRVEQARLTERARIAREMHDVLGHRISLLCLHAGALEVRSDARPDEIAIAAATIRSSAHEALEELRTVIRVLRDGPAEGAEPPQPGLPDLARLVDSARAHGMTVGYECRVPPDGPSAVLGRTAYRVVQEGLTNAGKHAPGAPVSVLVDGAAGRELRVAVSNPCAAAVSTVPSGGAGLVGIRERLLLAGGRVEYGTTGDRFRLEAWLPWPA
ncbi:sensor histidine kinase [Dactylosporangium sucinum]|uniref:histidine kinase n=1 Tax=Dactylosporangium sucinum TaxID=1424081 RepID=A0A917U9Z0_9ACTN|nr:histidine kinase [Dactylosporangium sucinum]GGM68753.1 two-component sensor histidine kinase [Dactylosporangium sucinum]